MLNSIRGTNGMIVYERYGTYETVRSLFFLISFFSHTTKSEKDESYEQLLQEGKQETTTADELKRREEKCIFPFCILI